jgi:hypothetical protein
LSIRIEGRFCTGNSPTTGLFANNESPHGLAIACQDLLFSVGDTKEKKPIRTFRPKNNVRFAPKAEMCGAAAYVRFGLPIPDIGATQLSNFHWRMKAASRASLH